MKNKYVDFLFVYEIRSREVENNALLGYELKRRGYSVAFVNTWHNIGRINKRRISCKVAVVFAAYRTSVVNYMLEHVKCCDKIINMQWEQLISIGQKDDPTSDYYIQGKGKSVVHISWGPDNYKRLVEDSNIDKKFVKMLGHVGMDFLRPEFSKYYKSRKEICELYGIPKDKKICLFVSSFSYVNIPEHYVQYVGWEFVDISNKSQHIILEWIVRVLRERDDIVFIYRPHPAEAKNETILRINEENENLFVISDMSIKQWLVISDVVYNWYSTSLMEIYSSGKSCYMLRPIEIPRRYEVEIFENGEFISEYDRFKLSLDKGKSFPYSDEHMKKYYYTSKERPAYIDIIDTFEEVYKDDEYNLPEGFIEPFKLRKKDLFFWSPIGKLFDLITIKWGIAMKKSDAIEKNRNRMYTAQLKKQNFVSNREIDELMEYIAGCLE